MLIFILNTFLSFTKVLTYSWFTSNQIFFKVVFIIFLILLLYLFYKYPRPLKNDINIIAEHYKIHNNLDKLFCYFMLILYAVIFVGGIIYLRFQNSSKTLDMTLVWNKFYSSILTHTLSVNILNLLLLILLIITYIALLIKLVRFFKRYWIKLHIYYADEPYNWYNRCRQWFTSNLDYISIISHLWLKLYDKYPKSFFFKRFLGFSIEYHLRVLARKIHYIIFLIIFIYDVLYNNYVLYNVYSILPYVFIYELYLKLCYLYRYSIDVMYSATNTAHSFIYAKTMTIMDRPIKGVLHIYIDGDYYEIENLAKVMFLYVNNGLNAGLLCKAIDGEERYKSYYCTYCYYKDWKYVRY